MFSPANWFMDFIQGAADALSDSVAKLLGEIAKVLLFIALPGVDEIRSDWFLLKLGGTYGLATKLAGLVAVAVALIIVATPTRNHGLKLERSLTSVFGLAIFAVAFFPVYSLLIAFSHGLAQGVLNLASGSTDATPDSLVEIVAKVGMPNNPFGALITALFAGLFGLVAVCEAVTLQLWLYLLLLVYPLVIAIRPLGKRANDVFNACNSGLVVVVTAPPLMVLGLLLPVIAQKHLPLGDLSVIQAALTIVGGLFAMAAPAVLAVFLFRKSSEIFGHIDATVGGRLDIDSMPPVTTRELQESVDDEHGSGMKAFLSTVGMGAMGADLAHSDDLFGDIKKLVVEGVSVAAASTGHVWVAGAAQMVDTTLDKEKRQHAADQNPEGGA